jgi:hypothetical protein
MFKFKKIMLRWEKSFRVRNPGIVTIRRTFGTRGANFGITRAGVMNPGIINIRRKFGMRWANTRTTWYQWGIFRELPPHKRGIHRRKGIPTRMTSLCTRIQDQNSRKILRTVPGSAA